MTPPDHPEALALHAALWGDHEPVLDAIDDGTLTTDLFLDPDHKATAEAVLAVVLAGNLPTPERVTSLLVSSGIPTTVAIDSVLLVDTFEAADLRLGGFSYYLHRLHEDRRRRVLEARLVALAASLYGPGGPDRVARILEGATS